MVIGGRWWLALGVVGLACVREPEPPERATKAERLAAREGAAADADDGPAPPPLDVALLRRHIAALADDAMQGRRPGTKGGVRAVAYIRAQMDALGLQPAGEGGGWTQTVPMRAVTVDASRSSIALRSTAGGTTPLRLGEEIVGGSLAPAGTTLLEAPLVFLGYGITAPEHGWDDYEGVDLRGAVVVVLVGDPPLDDGRFDGEALTLHGRWTTKLERALEAGAAGCLVVHETAPASYGWNVVRSSWSGERFTLDEPDGTPAPSLELQGWIHRDLAERLAERAGQTLAQWRALALRPDFEPVVLPDEVVAEVVTSERSLSDLNVLGMIPGRTRPSEHVLVTAHWDHLGIDPHAEPGQDAIFNGAVDNASGIAAMLGIAAGLRARARRGQGPGRSVIFVATTAEEQGLLGSRHYAEHPLVPRSSIVAVANLDSMNVHGRTTTVAVPGLGRSTLDEVLAEVVAAQGRTVVGDEHPGAGSEFRSDHFSFARRGIPAITFRGGTSLVEGGIAAGSRLASEGARRYHTVDDELEEAWPLTGALQDTEAMLELVQRVADDPEVPRWKPGRELAPREPPPSR